MGCWSFTTEYHTKQKVFTVLTQNYAPIEYKPPPHPLLFAKICCGSIFISNLGPPDHFLLDEILHLTSNLQWSTRTSLSANGPCTLKHFDKLCDAITTAHEIFSCKKLLNDWCLVAV